MEVLIPSVCVHSVQVGSLSPGIEVWDMDVLDAVEPVITPWRRAARQLSSRTRQGGRPGSWHCKGQKAKVEGAYLSFPYTSRNTSAVLTPELHM